MKAASGLTIVAAVALGGCGDDTTTRDLGGRDGGPGGLDATADAAEDAVSDARPETGTVFDAPLPMLDSAMPGDPCNGDPAACDKTYDAIAYPTAHAAMAYAFPPFACPAQTQSVRTQLDHGIRGLDLEVRASTSLIDGASELALCLGSCAAGELPVSVALSDVSAFLAVNPREIVTLLFEGGADAGQLSADIVAAGLDRSALSHKPGDPWPTLHAMIAAGTRVVVLADVTGSPPPWMLPLWTTVRETGRTFTSPAALTCDITRGAANAPLLLLNEFLVDGEGGSGVVAADGGSDDGGDGGEAGSVVGSPLGPGCDDPALAHVVNGEPFFTNRVTACTQQLGVKPTFVSVDDFEDGDLSGVIRALNP
jgi:hypothetical protein